MGLAESSVVPQIATFSAADDLFALRSTCSLMRTEAAREQAIHLFMRVQSTSLNASLSLHQSEHVAMAEHIRTIASKIIGSLHFSTFGPHEVPSFNDPVFECPLDFFCWIAGQAGCMANELQYVALAAIDYSFESVYELPVEFEMLPDKLFGGITITIGILNGASLRVMLPVARSHLSLCQPLQAPRKHQMVDRQSPRTGHQTGSERHSELAVRLAAALPDGSALAEYSVDCEQHYKVRVITKGAPTGREVSLGPVNAALLRRTFRGSLQQKALRMQLFDPVMDVVEHSLGHNFRHLFLVPAGALFMLSFGALPNDDSGHVIDREFSISYLLSANCLLGLHQRASNQSPLASFCEKCPSVVLAGDDFPCSRREATVVEQILSQSTGTPAIPSQSAKVLRQLEKPPPVLHIIGDCSEIESELPADESPMQRCRVEKCGEEPIDSSTLNAKVGGTHLVTLACCSPMHVLKGQPVGIGPVILFAGARTVLMNVHLLIDEASCMFMEAFYGMLLCTGHDTRCADALRHAQRILLSRPEINNRFRDRDSVHGWVLYGEPGPVSSVLHGDPGPIPSAVETHRSLIFACFQNSSSDQQVEACSIQSCPSRMIGPACFPFEARIRAIDGDRFAHHLHPGVEILSESGQTVRVKKALQLPAVQRDFVEIFIQDGSFTLTGDHTVMVHCCNKSRLMPVKDLRSGMLVRTDQGVRSIDKVQKKPAQTQQVVAVELEKRGFSMLLVVGSMAVIVLPSTLSRHQAMELVFPDWDVYSVSQGSDEIPRQARSEPSGYINEVRQSFPPSFGSWGHPDCAGQCRFNVQYSCKYGFKCTSCHILGCQRQPRKVGSQERARRRKRSSSQCADDQ